MNFSKKLEILLHRKHINKVDFANQLNITYRALAYQLTGQRMPRKKTLVKMASVLGVTAEFLKDDEMELKLSSSEKLLEDLKSDPKTAKIVRTFLNNAKELFKSNNLTDENKNDLAKCVNAIYADPVDD